MILLELFIGFFKVGCFAFGGAYGTIPLIREVVLSYGWLSEERLNMMIAVSESTPGPIMVNLATYVGTIKAGLAGAVLSTAAVVLPSFLIICLLTAFFQKAIDHPWVKALLSGLRPCMIGLILASALRMIMGNIHPDGFHTLPLILTLLLFAIKYAGRLLFKKEPSSISLILIGALLGLVSNAI